MLSYGANAQIKVPEVPGDDNMLDDSIEYAIGENRVAEYPGPPWFHWHKKGGHLGYQVQHQGKLVQCPYIHYAVLHSILYKMGTEGADCQRFAREVFTSPQSPVEAPGVKASDLDIFTRDVPFKFMVDQALERLGDPGTLAEVVLPPL
jgi:hypothetical protein